MRDVYCEQIIKRDGGTKTAVLKFALWFFAVLFSLVILFFALAEPMVMTFFPIAAVGLFWLAHNFARNMNLEYEYAVTGGELDIDKIAGRRKRSRVLTVQTRDFKILAPYSEGWKNEYNSAAIRKTIDVSVSPNSDGNWFIRFEAADGINTILIFTPNDKLLSGLAATCRRVIQGYNG